MSIIRTNGTDTEDIRQVENIYFIYKLAEKKRNSPLKKYHFRFCFQPLIFFKLQIRLVNIKHEKLTIFAVRSWILPFFRKPPFR